MRCLHLVASFSVLGLAACGAPMTSSETAEAPPTRPSAVKPGDFALLSCEGAREQDSCIIIAAGGKRVLIGAPISAMTTMPIEQLVSLDGVLLFSLRADDIGGLGAYRQRTWEAGRGEPMVVFGPSGTDKTITGLNVTYEASDAITYLDAAPQGGFNAALLASREADASPSIAFDTGDLAIRASYQRSSDLSYEVTYGGETVVILPCQSAETSSVETTAFEACPASWPSDPLFVNRP